MATAQGKLEGVLPENPAIERAAKDYVAVRDERMGLTKKEVEARAVLINAMKAGEVEFYKTSDGLECTLSSTDKVKVKGGAGGDEEE